MAKGIFKPPPIRFYTPKQLRGQANKQVQASIRAQQAPIKAAQEAADARASAAQQAMLEFGQTAAGMLKDTGSRIGEGYRTAGLAQGQLAQGFSGQAAQAVQDQIDRSQAIISQQAPGGQLAAPDVQGMQNTMYAEGGYIPGSSLEEQAAAANRWGAEQPGIQLAATREDVGQAQRQQAVDDQQYVQDMLNLAAQEPQLRQQIMQQLQQNEMAKRSAWVQQQAQQMVNQRFNVSSRQAQQRINIEQRRMRIAEQQGNARLALEAGNLRLSQARQRQSVRQALINGQRIDSSASHAAGYLIDRNGNPILDRSGKRIAVQSASSGRGGAKTGPGSTSWKEAYRYAQHTYAQQNIAGVPDPTWKQPPMPKMVTYLSGAYGLTRGQARKLLIGMGFKANGKRPGKK